MTTAIAQKAQGEMLTWTPDQVDLIQRTVAKGASPDEFKLFLYQCARTGLDPLARQIYAVVRGGKMTIQTAIDGYRLVADRTGKYAGSDDATFTGEPKKDLAATVTVYKIVEGVRCPFTATARWTEYFPGDSQGAMWKKMPHTMLAKCAEALALRKAFPADLSGIYTKEEMDQAGDVVDATVVPQPALQAAKTINQQQLGVLLGLARTTGVLVGEDTASFKKFLSELLGRPVASGKDVFVSELTIIEDALRAHNTTTDEPAVAAV